MDLTEIAKLVKDLPEVKFNEVFMFGLGITTEKVREGHTNDATIDIIQQVHEIKETLKQLVVAQNTMQELLLKIDVL